MVYAVSDLHGQYELFLKGLYKIGFSDKDYLYVVGDAIDRGPHGVKILDYIRQRSNMDLILGNHEYMMIKGLFGPREEQRLWLDWNGGRTTLAELNMLDRHEQVEICNWLTQRYVSKVVMVNGKAFCLVHSSFNKDVEGKRYSELRDNEDDVYRAVWFSPYRRGYSTRIPFSFNEYPYTFITGHVPVQRIVRSGTVSPYTDRNVVNIDGGCAFGEDSEISCGALFYCLDNETYRFIPLDEVAHKSVAFGGKYE